MKINRKKLQRTLGVVESVFLMYVAFCVNLAMRLLEMGGRFALVFIPIFDFIHAERYWKQSEHLQDPPLKIFLNKLFYGSKVLVSAVGAALAIFGGAVGNMVFLEAGFGVMIAMGIVGVARNLLKINLNWDNAKKVHNNAVKVAIGTLISVGFALMTFIPTVPFIPGLSLTLGNLGGLLVFAAASFIFLATAPATVLDLPVKAKNQPEFEQSGDTVFSANYDAKHVNKPLFFARQKNDGFEEVRAMFNDDMNNDFRSSTSSDYNPQ